MYTGLCGNVGHRKFHTEILHTQATINELVRARSQKSHIEKKRIIENRLGEINNRFEVVYTRQHCRTCNNKYRIKLLLIFINHNNLYHVEVNRLPANIKR